VNDIDSKLLKALGIAFPGQLWRLYHDCMFELETGGRKKFYSREQVVEMLNRERAALEVKANLIQHHLEGVKGD